MRTLFRVIFVILGATAVLLIGARTIRAQANKPTFVIAMIPMRWSGSLDDFDRAAEAQISLFVQASRIEQYAEVQVVYVHERLDSVDLSEDLIGPVEEFGLRTAPADRYVGLTDGDIVSRGRSSVAGYTRAPDGHTVVAEAVDPVVTAHELGHTFSLCDEYSWGAWEAENALWGCPNPYPDACPRTNFVDCDGYPPPGGGQSIMGAATGAANLAYNQPSLDHLDLVFRELFGQRQPPPVATPGPTSPPTPGPSPTPAPSATPMPTPVPQQIAFVNNAAGDFQLYLGDTLAGTTRRVAALDGSIFAPTWSPGGARLAVASVADTSLEIFTMRGDGRDLQRLTSNAVRDDAPAWSPDGSLIAFVSDRDGNPELYVMHADGTDVRRLTDDPARDEWPGWSPDGRELVFASDRDGLFQIYVIELPAASGPIPEPRRITHTASAAITPAWSPDGGRIAFAVDDGDDLEIALIDPDGQRPERLTANNVNDWAPQWRRGEQALVYQSADVERVLIQSQRIGERTPTTLFDLSGSSAAPAPLR